MISILPTLAIAPHAREHLAAQPLLASTDSVSTARRKTIAAEGDGSGSPRAFALGRDARGGRYFFSKCICRYRQEEVHRYCTYVAGVLFRAHDHRTANSPFLFGKSLSEERGYPSSRPSIQAMRAPSRVSFGSGYIDDPLPIFENIGHYSVLLPTEIPDGASRLSHLRLHNGTIWRWNRLLIGVDGARPTIRVEHRVMPAGPTIIDMIANAALYVARRRFLSLRDAPEADIAFETARDNFYSVARDGLDARITWLNGAELTVRDLLADELLQIAHQGLSALGIDGDDARRYLALIGARVRAGQNGARWQREL